MSEVFTSLRRTPYQTLAAFSVLFFTLLLSGFLFVFVSFLDGPLNYVETRPQVIVYFQPKAPETDIFSVRDDLMKSDKVASVKYVSKKDAFNIYKDMTKDNPLLLEMTTSDILPASLEIYAKEPRFLAQIAESIKSREGADQVQFPKNIVDRLLNLTTIVRRVTVIFFGYLLFMSVIVLTTTTSFKIALKKDEIELLRLLGATNSYIRKPFIQESVVLGMIATIIANIVLFASLLSLSSFSHGYLSGIQQLNFMAFGLPIPVWPLNPIFVGVTFVLTACFSLIIALSASFSAANRFLR